MTPLLAIRGLRTEFPTDDGLVVAVEDVDLDVFPGECLGVVGESGSGKSVTFLSVLGLVRAPGRVAGGSVVFQGHELRALSPDAMRALRGKAIALTFQDAQTALNPALRVEEQITEVLLAHAEGPRAGRAALRDRALDLLRLVGIPAPETRIADYPHQFSGGMRQRIMIAIALACRPRLLIADEPTSALDVTIQAQVLDLLDEIRRDLGTAVVLITHDLGVVAERCDRVAVMYAGQVVETGPTEQVIAAPRHPYTAGLLASAPWLDALEENWRPMPGVVPSLIAPPAGCRFAARCPRREEACAAPIALAQDGPRAFRCIRPLDVP
ncbi:ABC transporter ATP-binding protein [Falsiroseomonas sp. HW251]|uniref:ABC transporter ATP-binding protein n=1 Tax=Falsiroseomonas sp. HW251 TaxID=3390998 RepID=UPI003D315807